MKAITVRQPWGWAILRGHCPVLTVSAAGHEALQRHLDTDPTRQLVLHASEHHALLEDAARVDVLTDHERPAIDSGDTAAASQAFIGLVTLAGEAHSSGQCLRACGPWGFTRGFHYPLTAKRTVLARPVLAVSIGVRDLSPDECLAVLKQVLG